MIGVTARSRSYQAMKEAEVIAQLASQHLSQLLGLAQDSFAHNPQHCQQWRGAKKSAPKHKVVLKSNVDGLGRPGEIVQVSPGFARNYLIPHGTALPAMPKFLQMVQKELRNAPKVTAPGPVRAAANESGAQGSGATQTQPWSVAESGMRSVRDAQTGTEAALAEADFLREAVEVAERLSASRVNIRVITPHKSNQVRTPVTTDMLIAEVKRQLKIQLHEQNFGPYGALSVVGDYEVPLTFPKGIPLPGGREGVSLNVRLRRK